MNRAIQDGISSGKDINDKAFKRLKSSTTSLRAGSTPLKSTGTLRKTKLTKATKKNLVFEIKMVGKSKRTLPELNGKKVNRKSAGKVYGAFHNQKGGYTTSSSSAIPNRRVPRRNWFGIPKSVFPGGKEWKKATVRRKIEIRKALRTVMK